ncbi:MAG: LysR substrate-binding domain-containing protein [Candidatus Eisenbacteria bacterium]
MRLSDLESFVQAVRAGSLSAAARRLFVTQPAISARLRRLEREVGERLLVRSGRGVHPTARGARLFARCGPLLEELKQLESELHAEERIGGRLAIGATDLVAIYHLPAALARLRRRFPALEVQVQVEGTAELIRSLEAGAIEFAIVTAPVSTAGLELSPLFEDPLVVVAAHGHPLAAKRRVTAELVAAQPWLNHKRESVTRLSLETFFAGHGVALRTEMEISSPEAIKALVKAGLGVAALPARAVARELREAQLELIQVVGFDLRRGSSLAVRRGAPLSRAARSLVDLLRTEPRRGRSRPERRTQSRSGKAARPRPKT